MAYKFQVGNAILSGSLTQEGNIELANDAGATVGIWDNDGVLSGALGATAASFTCDGAVTAGSFVIGSADISEAELETIDGVTAGTAAANKAVVLDGSKNIATIGTVGCGAITSTGNSAFAQVTTSGRVIVDDATEATSATDGSLQTDGGLSVAKSAVIGDDLDLLSDGAIMNIGSTSKFTLTAVDANNAVMTTANHRLAFGNAGEYIAGDGTDLKIVSSGLLDITGDTKVTGFISGSGVLGGSAAKISGSVLAVSLTSEAAVTVGTLLKMPDNTSAKILVADGTSFQEVAVSGDVTIDNAGAVTIANDAVAQAMIADDAVGADQLAANAVVEASIADNAVTLAKMAGLARGKIIYGDASGDPAALAAGADGKVLVADANGDPSWTTVSGDATLAAGALTIAANAVEGSMLNTNAISGQTALASGLALTDELMVSDAGTLKRMDISLIAPAIAGAGLAASGGQLTVQGNAATLATDTVILSEGYNYFTGSATAVCTLPSGSIGDVVTVKAGPTAFSKTITISRSGSQDTIDGATSLVLESPYAAVTMVYVTHGDWRIV